MAEPVTELMADKLWIFQHAYLILLLPLLAFLINGLGLGKKSWKAAATLSVSLMGIATLLAIYLAHTFFVEVLEKPQLYPFKTLISGDFTWLPLRDWSQAIDWSAHFSFYWDALSVMMIVVICCISTLVLFYSIGYMREDKSAGRFFALLPFFSFTMLGLVTAGNLLQTFVFWELVGTASYLLIGFWYTKPEAVAASKKAFIVTRFADAFFLFGILIIGNTAHSLNFEILNGPLTANSLNHPITWLGGINLLTLTTLLIFTGGWGKSAMFPLHVWLPDAMEGPTPVSSIIHSATMVVAGVFLTARLFPLFAASDITLHFIEALGLFTALFAAIIACTQIDLKRILAFSTLSQLGLMLFALGTAKLPETVNALGYSAAVFHIFNHAFFKCLLFLSAGMLIHAVHSQDIRDFGGLRKDLPITYWTTLIACLAIAGIWPLSGFFSKDAILLSTWQSGDYPGFVLALTTGGLTAFYMFRYFFLIFHGPASSHKKKHHAQEAEHHSAHKMHEDKFMSLPMILLAIPSILSGILAHHFFPEHFTPAMSVMEKLPETPWLPYVASCAGILGILIAFVKYARPQRIAPPALAKSGVYGWIRNKFYIDELYLYITHDWVFRRMAAPLHWIEDHIVDGVLDLFAHSFRLGGAIMRFCQTGRTQLYLGMTIIGIYCLYRFGGLPF